MSYFNRLPEIVYNRHYSVDLHKKLVLARALDSNWITSYALTDGETLHDVSYSLYGTTDYWWLLALINNYNDVHYDMMIKDDVLQKLAKQLQVIELTDVKQYILFPPETKIQYQVNGKDYTASVIRKYISNVSGEGSRYLADVLLDDVEQPIPESLHIKILDSRLSKVTVYDDSSYNNGDLVRQDLYSGGNLEEFARGIIIYKDGNDLYLQKTKSVDFVTSGESYGLNGEEVTGNELVLSKRIYAEGSDISNAERIEEFDVNEFGLRDLYYIYRYDKLVEINNQNQKLVVIKPSYLNVLKNNLIILDEEGS